MKLTIPLNLTRRLCDLTWYRSVNSLKDADDPVFTHNQALALLVRLWMFFCENRTGRMEDTLENRAILAGSLCIASVEESSRHIELMIQAGILRSVNGLLILHEYEELQKDNASKGAHGRAASISMSAAKRNAEQLVGYFHSKGVESVHSPESRKRAYLILINLNAALGRKPMSHGEYTDEVVSDVLNHIPNTITDDEIKRVCAWVRRYATFDRRLKQSMPTIITQHWQSIYEASLKDEGPLA